MRTLISATRFEVYEMVKQRSPEAQAVYDLFTNNPLANQSSYLFNYWKAGKLRAKPVPAGELARAAYDAGRVCAKSAEKSA